jgi:hypothetical protein
VSLCDVAYLMRRTLVVRTITATSRRSGVGPGRPITGRNLKIVRECIARGQGFVSSRLHLSPRLFPPFLRASSLPLPCLFPASPPPAPTAPSTRRAAHRSCNGSFDQRHNGARGLRHRPHKKPSATHCPSCCGGFARACREGVEGV